MQKQRKLLCFCICFAFVFCFFPDTTSALMRTFTRQQYLLYAPRKNCENKAKNTVKKNDKHAQLHCFAFLLLYTIILAPCIYGWRARHKPTSDGLQPPTYYRDRAKYLPC